MKIKMFVPLEDVKMASDLLSEASQFLEKLPEAPLTEAGMRWPIMDEMAGASAMLLDSVKAFENADHPFADENEFDDEDHPLWCINTQIQGLLEGFGANEDHDAVIAFLTATGLPPGTVKRMHAAIVNGDSKILP